MRVTKIKNKLNANVLFVEIYESLSFGFYQVQGRIVTLRNRIKVYENGLFQFKQQNGQ